jgi:hypothetical protein
MTNNLFEIINEDSSLVDVPIYIISDGNYTFESYGSKMNSKLLCALLNERERLKTQKKQLQETLAYRSNQLALMEKLIDDLGSEEIARQMGEILND